MARETVSSPCTNAAVYQIQNNASRTAPCGHGGCSGTRTSSATTIRSGSNGLCPSADSYLGWIEESPTPEVTSVISICKKSKTPFWCGYNKAGGLKVSGGGRLEQEGHTSSCVFLFPFYLVLHPAHGTLVKEGNKEFCAVTVKEFQRADIFFFRFAGILWNQKIETRVIGCPPLAHNLCLTTQIPGTCIFIESN